jgi:tight adherence protein C
MSASILIYPILASASAFFFSVSLIPGEDLVAKKLDELKSNRNAPQLNTTERMLQRMLTQQQRGQVRRKLSEAGWYRLNESRIVAQTIGSGLLGLLVVLLLIRGLGINSLLGYIVGALAVAAAAYVPYGVLDRAAEKRKREVQRALPDFLDMVASTVQAGLSLNAAMAYAVESAEGALGDEMREALAEIRLGRSRHEALQAAAERLNQAEFTTMVTAIIQCERLGSNIAHVLTELADDTRSHRILFAEEQAQKLPVKMVFPMAFFMLPALFTIIFGSIISNLLTKH